MTAGAGTKRFEEGAVKAPPPRPRPSGVRLNDLPGIEGLEQGDRIKVVLKRSNRVRKGSRGKAFDVVFEGVRASGTGGPDENWILEGRLGDSEGLLQGFHDWSIRSVERVASDPATTIGPDDLTETGETR